MNIKLLVPYRCIKQDLFPKNIVKLRGCIFFIHSHLSQNYQQLEFFLNNFNQKLTFTLIIIIFYIDIQKNKFTCIYIKESNVPSQTNVQISKELIWFDASM